MRLLLIRHGETVDNVAGLYAGVRDSALTIHGVEQTRKLASFLLKNQLRPTHVFASPLQRAYKTAEALVSRSSADNDHETSQTEVVQIVKVDELIEQDFGSYEGKPFHARSDTRRLGLDARRDAHKDQPGFVDVESKDSLAKRADLFLDKHLLPLFASDVDDGEQVIAVVSHGILLSSLWKRLLARLPRKSLTIAPEVTSSRGPVVLEHLGGWSNTGYLDLELRREKLRDADETTPKTQTVKASTIATPQKALSGWAVSILAIDSKQHLQGLKRQRGGIGRMAHDDGQRKLEGFFKIQRKS